jgi:hypothetical protein
MGVTVSRLRIGISLRVALGVLLLVGVVGCSGYYRGGPPIYRSAYYHHPYHYYYYPSTSVYFHISSGYYYYRDGDYWRHAKQLPPKYHLDHHDRVPVWIDAEKPFTRYKQHRDKYKPKPGFRPDPKRDPEERRNNERMHERYRNR